MHAKHFLTVKHSQAEQNAEDQRNLSNPETATYWSGRAAAYKEMLEAINKGVVTPEGITRLSFDGLEPHEPYDPEVGDVGER
ncbi:MAG: hypothetical protein ABJN42_15995 [Roseibium sp.]|uniref:hypothetical protein n=1 Tax=Roseibium sp. TaxID=1936156 RepID=UPI0032983040